MTRTDHVPVALPFRQQFEQPPHALLHLPLPIAPETLFQLTDEIWNCSVMGITLAMGVSLLVRMALACEAKANLHPLAFYTIEVTSPLLWTGVVWLAVRISSLIIEIDGE